ncbi:aminotransferase [Agaricicola taiwanensis]|uniref:Aminotransferase n=1 Tax=Agaricicola taiwanensis TaxID=591372 RepID=A0A8J2YMU7_9RHOB|nr:aminotransferase class I/II-fold pyridoxal phosphate-dependent enzyme [Agaricicola taiwanensis]GGE53183.1 aminotransferase [Agaricicola taiwanensis]
MSVVSAKLRQVKLSPSVAARAIVANLREQGRRIIDLTVGEPDFPTPDHIRQAAREAIDRGDTKYPLSQGTLALRRAVQQRLQADVGQSYPVDQIIVSTGAKQVLYNGLAASLEAGDEVIVPTPYWVSYPDMVELAGGTPVFAGTSSSEAYKLIAEVLERAISPKTKWLMLNSPSNPSGALYSAEELREMAGVLRAHPHVWVMTDDIYARLSFGGQNAPHLLQVAPDLADRTLVVNGVSKAYAMTGWRIGYGAGPKDLIKAMAVVQSQSTSGASTIGQVAALAALTGPQDCVDRFTAVFKERRDLAVAILSDVPGLGIVVPDGAFYVFPDCSALIGKKTPSGEVISSDVDLVQHILSQAGVALIDGSSYGIASTFRVSFAASNDDVRQGCEAIRDVCLALA